MAPAPSPQPLSRRKRRIIRIVLALATGGVLGQLCPFLPIRAQVVCHIAAKVLSIVAGGS